METKDKMRPFNLAVSLFCFGMGIVASCNGDSFFAVLDFSLAALNLGIGSWGRL